MQPGENEDDRNLCYRINHAGESLALVLADLTEKPTPDYETPDDSVVSETDHKHPIAQCRLDTTFAASMCKASFDQNLIPGKEVSQGTDSIEAEEEGAANSCTDFSNFSVGQRPTCWYKPRI